MNSGTCADCRKSPTDLVAKGLCWACYQRDRRSKQAKRITPACIAGRRYHSYDDKNVCRFCFSHRVFAN